MAPHTSRSRGLADLEQLQEDRECAVHEACQRRPVLFILELILARQDSERKEGSIEPSMILQHHSIIV